MQPFTYSLLAVLCFTLVLWYRKNRRLLPLPPGPPPRLISGNGHQLPRSNLWKVLSEWSAAYGRDSVPIVGPNRTNLLQTPLSYHGAYSDEHS